MEGVNGEGDWSESAYRGDLEWMLLGWGDGEWWDAL